MPEPVPKVVYKEPHIPKWKGQAKAWRDLEKQGFSQAEIARKEGVSRVYVSKIMKREI